MQLVMYGRVGMLRDFCAKCQRTALVVDGALACCDTPIQMNQAITSLKREALTIDVRHLNKWQKEYILEEQGNRCFYCNQRFGSTCFYKGREITLTRHFDHIIPMAYQADNTLPNIVAACKQCNQWKGTRIFSSIEEARAYLSEMWERHRHTPLLKKRDRVRIISYGVDNLNGRGKRSRGQFCAKAGHYREGVEREKRRANVDGCRLRDVDLRVLISVIILLGVFGM